MHNITELPKIQTDIKNRILQDELFYEVFYRKGQCSMQGTVLFSYYSLEIVLLYDNPHCSIELRIGRIDSPNSDNAYSTLGGTSA